MPQSLDQTNMMRGVQAREGDEVSGQDTEIAVRMAIQMLTQGNGLQVISDAINKSQDPAMVVGQFLSQMMGALGEQLVQQVGLDPAVFLAKEGFLDQILDYIETKLGYPEEFSDQIYMQVLETVKAAASSPPAPNNVMEGAYGPEGGVTPGPQGGMNNGG